MTTAISFNNGATGANAKEESRTVPVSPADPKLLGDVDRATRAVVNAMANVEKEKRRPRKNLYYRHGTNKLEVAEKELIAQKAHLLTAMADLRAAESLPPLGEEAAMAAMEAAIQAALPQPEPRQRRATAIQAALPQPEPSQRRASIRFITAPGAPCREGGEAIQGTIQFIHVDGKNVKFNGSFAGAKAFPGLGYPGTAILLSSGYIVEFLENGRYKVINANFISESLRPRKPVHPLQEVVKPFSRNPFLYFFAGFTVVHRDNDGGLTVEVVTFVREGAQVRQVFAKVIKKLELDKKLGCKKLGCIKKLGFLVAPKLTLEEAGAEFFPEETDRMKAKEMYVDHLFEEVQLPYLSANGYVALEEVLKKMKTWATKVEDEAGWNWAEMVEEAEARR